jgi:hypothetical protein
LKATFGPDLRFTAIYFRHGCRPATNFRKQPALAQRRRRHIGWLVTWLRKKGEFVDIVEAPDEATAIREAIERYGIREPWKQNRLVARQEA